MHVNEEGGANKIKKMKKGRKELWSHDLIKSSRIKYLHISYEYSLSFYEAGLLMNLFTKPQATNMREFHVWY